MTTQDKSNDLAKAQVAAESVCPVCHARNLSTDHLITEYLAMQRASFGLFKRNADAARDAVADILLARGVTTIPNLFGPIAIRGREDIV